MHLTNFESQVLRSRAYHRDSFVEFGSQARVGYHEERADARAVFADRVVLVEVSASLEMFYQRLTERVLQYPKIQAYWEKPVVLSFVHPPLGESARHARCRSMMETAQMHLGSNVRFCPFTASLRQLDSMVR